MKVKHIQFLGALSFKSALAAIFIALIWIDPANTAETYHCPNTCVSPACFCPSLNPPANLEPKSTPQFILLTFDDAVDESTYSLIKSLPKIKNPNGCPSHYTFFITTDYSNYWSIQKLYAEGHEIAAHTMTHTTNINTKKQVWDIEIKGAHDALSHLSLIPKEKIIGFRAPYLQYSEESFQSIHENNYAYDASIPEAPGFISKDPSNYIWPYTLDFGAAQNCIIGKCPKNNYAGLFEVPLWAHTPSDGSWQGFMDPSAQSKEALVGLLKEQFLLRYNGNRAPFGIFLHASWLKASSDHFEALNNFLLWANQNKDVWFITNQQLIQFMRDPAPASSITTKNYMHCKKLHLPAVEICDGVDNNRDGQIDEGLVNFCRYPEAQFQTCAACPSIWPTARYPDGKLIRDQSSTDGSYDQKKTNPPHYG